MRLLPAIKRHFARSVEPNGADMYEVTFLNAAREFRILLLPDGRIETVGFLP